MNTNKAIWHYLRAFLTLAALLAFIYLYGRAFVETLRSDTVPIYTEAYIYVATALAGLVGGIAATSLGQALPARYALRRRFQLLGRVLAPFQPENLQNTLAIAYTVVYILYGFVALILWLRGSETSQVVMLIRDLALIFLGLLLATAQGMFGYTDTTSGNPPELPPNSRARAAKAPPKPSGHLKRHK